MANEPDGPADPIDSSDIDPGEPVTMLADLRETPSTGFLQGIRARIQRRHLAADTLDFSLAGLAVVALAFLGIVFHALQPTDRTKGDE